MTPTELSSNKQQLNNMDYSLPPLEVYDRNGTQDSPEKIVHRIPAEDYERTVELFIPKGCSLTGTVQGSNLVGGSYLIKRIVPVDSTMLSYNDIAFIKEPESWLTSSSLQKDGDFMLIDKESLKLYKTYLYEGVVLNAKSNILGTIITIPFLAAFGISYISLIVFLLFIALIEFLTGLIPGNLTQKEISEHNIKAKAYELLTYAGAILAGFIMSIAILFLYSIIARFGGIDLSNSWIMNLAPMVNFGSFFTVYIIFIYVFRFWRYIKRQGKLRPNEVGLFNRLLSNIVERITPSNKG